MSNRKGFYAVQFIESPFEGIDDYVCVPHSWVKLRRETDRKVFVAHPKDEDPLVTRGRAKRREKCPNEWKCYMATIKYESSSYKDAESWIATRNNYGPCEEEELVAGDTQPKRTLDRKLRSSIRHPESNSKPNKPQLTVKPYENPRKPMVKISIKQPIQPKPTGDLDNKRLKLDEGAKLTGVIDYETMVPECSKRKQSIIIRDNQLIHYAQTMREITASNGETSTGQRTVPKLTQNNKSVVMSIQSTSSQLPCEKQPSFVRQDREQPLSMPVLDVVGSNDVEEDLEVLPGVTEESPSSNQTLPNTLEPSSQPQPVTKRPTSLVRQENLPQEPRPEKTSAGQYNGINDNSQRTQLHKILTAPTTVSEHSKAVNQPSQLHQHTQSQFRPFGESSYSNPQPRETDVGRSTEVTHDNPRPGLMTPPSTSHHVPNLIRISSQLFESKSRKPSSSVMKNPVQKKTRLENITTYISTAKHQSSNPTMRPTCSVNRQARPPSQNHLQVSQEPVNHSTSHIGGNGIDQRILPQGTINNTSAAQNLLNLAHQYRVLVERAHEGHLLTQEDYLQQIARVQDVLRGPNIAPIIDQRAYLRHSMMNGGFVRQNQANSINQPSQFLPRHENQFLPIDRNHLQQVLRPNLLGGSTEETHTVHRLNSQNVGIKIPFAAQNLSNVPNQSHHNVEYLQQRQNPTNYHYPQRDLPAPKIQYDPFNSISNSQRPEPQRVIKKTQPSALLNIANPTGQSNGHGNYLLRDPRIQVRLNQSSTDYHSNLAAGPPNITVEPMLTMQDNHSNLAAVPPNITVEPMPTMQDAEVQTRSSDPSHETQFILVPENHVYQHPRTKKLVVDQSTTTDFNMDRDHCDETVGSPVIESSPRVFDSECQTDDCLREESLSPNQEVASDHESIADHEIVSDQEEVSDKEISTDVPPLDMNNKISCTEESPPQNKTEERPTTVQNFTPENQQVHPRTVAEQQMLNLFATLFTQMGANMSYTCDMFHNVRNSILESAQTYQMLLEAVQAFNSMGNFPDAISPSDKVTEEVSQVTEERPAVESENANSGNGDEKNDRVVREAPENNRPRYTFVLPPEYDPNDSKWTLKYKKKGPGLVELMPQSGIYVNSLELKRCKRESKDCKMLARMLLTEVFSKKALSVCSLTGGKAKAFNTVDIDVRPGLDEHARMVLLAYVDQHGLRRKWNTSDTQSIISSIRSKINEMRAKYGKSFRC